QPRGKDAAGGREAARAPGRDGAGTKSRPHPGFTREGGFRLGRRLGARQASIPRGPSRLGRNRPTQESRRCPETDLSKVIPAPVLLSASFAFALLLGPTVARGEHTPGIPGWQQDVHYRMSVSYTPQTFEIAGQETLAYWNLSPDSLTELYFHLYLNAYRPESNLARHDASEEDWRIQNLPAKRRGGEWIEGATILSGDSLRVFVDDTIARIPLPEVLAPGESVIVCLSFRSRIPDVPERMGRSGKGVFAAQWYPKVCVYDRFGWHREQHLGSEFYGDFGSFDVRIALPGNFMLAHTGTLMNPAEVFPDSILLRLAAPGDSAITV